VVCIVTTALRRIRFANSEEGTCKPSSDARVCCVALCAWETDSRLAASEIIHVLLNPKVHYRVNVTIPLRNVNLPQKCYCFLESSLATESFSVDII
jgi:hypothetical protein